MIKLKRIENYVIERSLICSNERFELKLNSKKHPGEHEALHGVVLLGKVIRRTER